MFTGLVEAVGKIEALQESDSGKLLRITCSGLSDLPSLGASINISGCCLTVTDATSKSDTFQLSFDVICETLQCTTLDSLELGQFVNVEQSLRLDSRLGGHFVQGHVDGVEHVIEIKKSEDGDIRLQISMENIERETVVSKGSITIDGVSLTIAMVSENWFEVALIPTTIQETTLGTLQKNDRVNIETDILARTVVASLRKMHVR